MAAQETASRRLALETRQLYASILSPATLPDERQFARPQFKLIYELARSLAGETNALRGVFSANDFDPQRRWDRRAREQFAQRLVEFVAANKRPVVGLVAAKLVAGAEPIKTYELLQSLAKIVAAKATRAGQRPRTVTKQVRAQGARAGKRQEPEAESSLKLSEAEPRQVVASVSVSVPVSASESGQTRPLSAADVTANLQGARSSLRSLACTMDTLVSLENSLKSDLAAALTKANRLQRAHDKNLEQ